MKNILFAPERGLLFPGIALLLASLFLVPESISAQKIRFKPFDPADSVYQVTGKKILVPVLLAGAGFSQFMSDPVIDLNIRVRDEIQRRNPSETSLDDYLPYTPALAVYGLNLLGIKGKHNLIDRTVLIAGSGLIAGLSVQGMKELTHVLRPDGSAYNSFPSGHTAAAFACAEFLYQEYRDVSPWIGVAGYAAATGTGFLRMYNNRHWLTDVVAGAGFGILSTRLAYWVFPKIRKWYSGNVRVNISWIPPVIPL